MSPIWNNAWKDLVRFRLHFAAWTLLIVGKHLFFAFIAGVWGEANFAMLSPLQGGFGLVLTFALEPLVAYFLVACLIYEDPPGGKDPFWLTRPLSGGQLLAGKLLVAGAVLVLWPVLLSLPWWIECGFSSSEIAVAAGNLFAVYSTVVFVGVAAASATDSYPRYILWSFAGLAVLAIVLVAAQLFWSVPNGASSPAANLAHLNVILLLVVLLALQIIGHRFFIRYFRPYLVAGLVVTLFAGAWIFASPLTGMAAWFRPVEEVNSADDNIRLAVAGPMRVEDLGKNRSTVLAIPLRMDGLPDGTLGFLRVEGTWKSAEGKTWSNRGGSSFAEFLPRVARQLLRMPSADSAPPVAAAKFAFGARSTDGTTHAQRIAAEASSFQGAVTLQLAEGRLRAEVPLREQTARMGVGSFSLTQLERHSDRVTFTLTTRAPLNQTSWAAGLGYLALANRRTGEMLEPELSTRLGTGHARLNSVLVTLAPVLFKIPPVPGWLDDARLVMISFEHGRTIVRGLAVDPLKVSSVATGLSAERKPVQLPLEVLQRYTGTYLPEGKAPVTVTLENGRLVSRGADIPETLLYPESESRFYSLESAAIVEFVRDGQDVVTHVVIHDNGRDRIVPRTK